MSWFYRLPRRDQVAALLGLLALVLYGLWFGVVKPLQRYHSEQGLRTGALGESLLRVQSLAGEIALREQGAAAAPFATKNLSQLLDRSLRDNQLKMSGFQPGADGDVRLRLQAVEFEKLLQWLYQLEFVHRVQIGELSITPTRQRGQVSVQIRLLSGEQ